ncbi:MAG: glycosyltransferase family 1 protein [Candidatus Eisenbacteria bacterium]|nr:glycosyltransferase family 1 protein [Candidatus Eisenbacteria bacterium]
MARIVFATVGSLGDLHPYLAVARELLARGHRPAIATHEYYRERVTGAGLGFHPVRPDMEDFGDPTQVMRRAMDLRTGSQWVLEKLVLERLDDSCEDLLAAFEDADLAVGHVLTLSAVLAAEKLGVPRMHSVLQPMTMFSRFDPPVMPQLPFPRTAQRWNPAVWGALYSIMRFASARSFEPVHALRRRLGLPPSTLHPLLEMFTATGNLAMFSRLLSPPQPDWAPHTTVTGFCVWDRDEKGGGMDPALAAFLEAGAPPVVFTLGSSAVFDAGAFYDVAAAAARRLGVRAVLLTGPDGINQRAGLADGRNVIAVPYAPHSELFPRAAANVHAGGVGTTGQALASGRPMLVMPYSHDQPDNAMRCERLGVARVVPRGRWAEARVAAELGALLADGAAAARARSVEAEVRAEGGAAAAADAIEQALARA